MSQPEPTPDNSMEAASFHRPQAHDGKPDQATISVGGDTSQTTEATNRRQCGPASDISAPNSHWKNTFAQEKTLHGWTPPILRHSSILVFILCFLMILLSICALEIIDSKNEGLATTEISKHYLWTYGPTAVLAVVAAFWGQVEHRTKQLLPWSTLRKESTPAALTLLQEYVTLSQPEVLYKSLKQSQWAIFLATTGSLLLKLLTVASTGLLTLQIEKVTIDSCGLVAMDTYTPNPSYDPSQPGPGFTIVALFDGNISTYPVGTSEAIAFSTISLPESPKSANISSLEVSTNVFHSSLECETGDMTITPVACEPDVRQIGGCAGLDMIVEVHSPSCERYFETIDLNQFETNYTWAFGRAESLNCLTASSGTNSSRIVFAVGTVEQRISLDYSASVSMLNQTLISCTPRYTIKPMALELDVAGNLLKANGELDSNSMGDIQLFDHGALAQLFQDCLDAAMSEDLSGPRPGPNATATYRTPYPIVWSTTFVLLQLGHDPGSLEAWFKPDTLEDAATYLFTATSAQIVKQGFMKSVEVDVQGKCHGTQERLRTNVLALRLMQAMLAILTFITIGILFLRPKSVVSRDPGPIGGLATLLASSPALQEQISRLGISPLEDILSRLNGRQCQNPTGSTIEITAIEQPSAMANSPPSPVTWWCPVGISKWFISLVILFLALLLAVLEITFRLSKANDGLGTVETNGNIHYTWAYSPALVMVCMQICVGAIAFSYLLVAPYHTLKRQTWSTRDLLLKDYLSQTAIQSVMETCLSHDWAVLPVALSILLTPMLTIAVSGLFTTQATQSSHSKNITITTAFNSNVDVQQTINDWIWKVQFSLGLYFVSNISLSAWTFEEFVFPEIHLTDSNFLDPNDSSGNAEKLWNGSSLSVQLPAIRPNLDCTYTDTNGKNASEIEETHPSVSGCPQLSLNAASRVNNSAPFGFATILQSLASNGPPIPEECPRIYGLIGTSETNYTAFSCMSSVSEIIVLTELSFPELEILSITSDETTARPFMGNSLTASIFSSSFFDFVQDLFATDDFPPMFQAIMAESGHTPSDWPMNNFLGEENFPRLAGAMQHAFRIISSQAADIGLRVPAANDTSPITGTLSNPNVWHLYQNEPSTRILQAFLAAIALCVITSFVLMDVQKLLPKNPCSIAAAASLLADSDMLKPEITPEGAEWMSDSELKKAGVWDGYVFRLGWWGTDGEEMRYGIDAGRVDASRA